jgi:hypothetical protein
MEPDLSSERAARVALGIQLCALVIAAAVTLVAMLHGAGWKLEWSWFYPWALSPYLLLLALVLAAGGRSRAIRVAGLVATVAVLLAACLVYIDAMFIHVSSTSALIFIFGPLYFLVGGPLVFALAAWLGRRLAPGT